MKILHTVDVSEERSQGGKLEGSSWPLGVHFYRDETRCVDTHNFSTVQEAEEQAQEWAKLKRGNMAVVYQRTSGTVRAQYAQFLTGFLAFIRYNARHVMSEHHNLHLFAEVESVPEIVDESGVLPLVSSLHPQIVPLPDGEREEIELFAFLHAPVPNKISIDVVANRPCDEPIDEETLLTVQIDFTDGTLSVLCWNRERDGQDPHKFVAATLPVSAVTQRVSHYQRLREQGQRGLLGNAPHQEEV